TQGSQFIATQALSIGQNTFDFLVAFFVMLYLLFFLLRDGAALARRIEEAVPLDGEVKRDLLGKFATVVRATVKGNVVVAGLQGALGGLILWILGIHAPVLWGTLMAFLSLLPAVGAALVWLPVALYFLATGAIVKGVVLIVFGVLVIGLVDNILRPLLVGKDTKMPDYLVLVSTLGGMALFGLNGFVIGPVVAAMFIAVWNIFSHARQSRGPDAAAAAPQDHPQPSAQAVAVAAVNDLPGSGPPPSDPGAAVRPLPPAGQGN
ncbi:MAG: AI-2E family transporter, partial [Haliea sp.]